MTGIYRQAGCHQPLRFLREQIVILLLSCVVSGMVLAGDDPHYTEAGFFDIHVCNWPDQPLFLMTLFSTERFSEISRIEVIGPDNGFKTQLHLHRYRTLSVQGKPEKRIFIQHDDLPEQAREGWYTANILLKDGRRYQALDFVMLNRLPQVSITLPEDGAVLDSVPEELGWEPVSGAAYYQVFIRDLWKDGELVYASKLLEEPRLLLPDSLLATGGFYSWIIHARDSNETARLGDSIMAR